MKYLLGIELVYMSITTYFFSLTQYFNAIIFGLFGFYYRRKCLFII